VLARTPDTTDPRDAAKARIRDLKRGLDAATEQAQDLVRAATGDHSGGRAPPKPGRGQSPQPGSKQSRRALRDWVRKGLKDLVDGKGPHAGTAKGLLDEITEIEKEIAELERGLRPPPQPKFKSKATPADKQPAKAKTPPAPTKTPPAPTKPAPTSSSPGPTPRPLPPGEAASAAKQAGRLKSLAGRFARSIGRIASKVLGPLAVALQLLDALDMIDMSESAMRGEGFVFRQQLRESSELSAAVQGLIAAYRDSPLHEELDELVRTAVANDEKYSQYDVTPANYWGTEELSEFCQKAWSQAFDHATACEKLHDHLSRGVSEVEWRWKFCKAILDDPKAIAALSIPTTATAARVLGAYEDLTIMRGRLSTALSALTSHVSIVKDDLQVLDDNILQRGLVV
jgi:hypothetical protein